MAAASETAPLGQYDIAAEAPPLDVRIGDFVQFASFLDKTRFLSGFVQRIPVNESLWTKTLVADSSEFIMEYVPVAPRYYLSNVMLFDSEAPQPQPDLIFAPDAGEFAITKVISRAKKFSWPQ